MVRPSFERATSRLKSPPKVWESHLSVEIEQWKNQIYPTAIVRLAGIENSLTGHYGLPVTTVPTFVSSVARGRVSRNTLVNANSIRDWRIYADFAQLLTSQAGNCIAKTISAWRCKKWFIHSMARPSTCALPSSPGPSFASEKEPWFEGSLYRMLQILSVTLFKKTSILEALSLSDCGMELTTPGKQFETVPLTLEQYGIFL